MSSGGRIAVIVAAVAALVVAFVVLSPGGDEEQPAGTVGTQTAAPPPIETIPGGETVTTPAPPPPPAPKPSYVTIRVRGGEPVGGVKTIRVQKGDRARIQVTTTDTTDEIHLHGYDITRDLAPGRRARFLFKTDAEGIFEIELHGSARQIGKLVVEP